MTAYEGYVWFMPAWFTEQWWDTDSFNSNSKNSGYRPENVPCSTSQMLRAIQGSFQKLDMMNCSNIVHKYTQVCNKFMAIMTMYILYFI